MAEPLADLIRLLRPEPVAEGLYRGEGSDGEGDFATFGGHFLGQATAAALASVDAERRIHSLHAYFLRGGQPREPIDYAVTRVRDGRTFCTRRVTATQDGPPLFELTASFALPEDGEVFESKSPADFDRLPEPESLPRYHELMATHDPPPVPVEWAFRERGVDVRIVNAPWSPNGASAESGIRCWMRANGTMPDDPALHAAMLAYQSDESISDNVLVPFGKTWSDPDLVCLSLDHALWYHQPIQFDEWLFIDQRPVTVSRGRGFSSGTVWNRAGELVASFAQEALIRT